MFEKVIFLINANKKTAIAIGAAAVAGIGTAGYLGVKKLKARKAFKDKVTFNQQAVNTARTAISQMTNIDDTTKANLLMNCDTVSNLLCMVANGHKPAGYKELLETSVETLQKKSAIHIFNVNIDISDI